jgi:hypothetical protein
LSGCGVGFVAVGVNQSLSVAVESAFLLQNNQLDKTMLARGKPAKRQIDKLEAENALLAIQNCASVLHAIQSASEEPISGALDLVSDTLRARADELRTFFDAVVKAERPDVVTLYNARQPEAAAA